MTIPQKWRKGSKVKAWALLLATAWLAVAPGPTKADIALDSLNAPISQNELNSFKEEMATRAIPPHPWGFKDTDHNYISDGPAGRDVEAMGLMYEATGDVQILNRMIEFVDGFVAMRNDLAGGTQVVMWTGDVDPVWPGNGPARPPHNYAGGENGDTIAHILYCALQILQTPFLWNVNVPDGDPHGFGATYLQRARTYVARCDEANDLYSYKYFVTSQNVIRNPSNWPKGFHTMEAINIQMMLIGGYQRDAEAHEILGDNPDRVAKYNAVVKTAVRECLDGMKHAYTVNGRTVYKWGYYPWDTRLDESVGHANYDMIGIWRAWTRRSLYGITTTEVAPFADTLLNVISKGNNQFSHNVDGSGPLQNRIDGEWMSVAEWRPAVYDLIAQADVASGRYATSPHIAASILWMKQRIHGFSGYYKLIARHSGKAVNVSGASTANGAKIIQWPYGSAAPANDEWRLIDLGNGFHRIVARHSGKVLNVSMASTADGAQVDQWSWANVNQQQWQVTNLGSGSYRLTARHSGKVLEVSGASTANGANITQGTWSGGMNQQFEIVSVR